MPVYYTHTVIHLHSWGKNMKTPTRAQQNSTLWAGNKYSQLIRCVLLSSSCLCFDPVQNKTMRTFWCEKRNPRIGWDLSGLRRSSCWKTEIPLDRQQDEAQGWQLMEKKPPKTGKEVSLIVNHLTLQHNTWNPWMSPAAFSFPGGCVPSSGLVSIHDCAASPGVPSSLTALLQSLPSKPGSSCTLSSKPEPRASLFCKETPQHKEPPELAPSQGLLHLTSVCSAPWAPSPLTPSEIPAHTHYTARSLCPTRDMFIYYPLNFVGQFINKTWGGFQQRFDLNPTCFLYAL